MILTCPQCQATIATPTVYDDELVSVECGNCGAVVRVAEHGQRGGSDRSGCFGAAVLMAIFIQLTLLPTFDALGDSGTISLQQEMVAALAGSAAEAGIPRSSPSERARAADVLVEKIAQIGLHPQRHRYRLPNVNPLVDLLIAPLKGTNVYTVLESTIPNAEFVILGAHYDSDLGSPGAVDNATGVALIYAVAEQLARRSHRRLNYLFAFFDQEEDDEVGSQAFVRYLIEEDYKVHSVHIVDMVGWDGDDDQAVEIQSPPSELERAYREAASRLDIPLFFTKGASSDTRSFRAAGFETVGVWETISSGDSTPHYHKSSDTYETVNFEYLASTTALVSQVMSLLEDPR